MAMIPERLIKLAETLRRIRWQGRAHNATPMQLYRRAISLRHRRGFGFRDALHQGLLDPALPAHALGSTLAKMLLVHLQRRLTREGRECLTEDKSLFYPYCEVLNLPVPRTHAVNWVAQGVTTAMGTP
jgi:hypothetical protein